jgi:hypothetical protein
LKNRLVAEFARDKKKAIILGMLLLVAVFYVSKLLVKGSPEAATAASMQAPGASESSEAENASLDLLTGKPRTWNPKDRSKGIARDIFLPNVSLFPLVVTKTVEVKGPDVIQETQEKRNAELLKRKRAEIRQQGAALHLESTITGGRPIAIINGSVLGRDGVINGFRIIKVGSQTCVVEKDGVKLNLTME